MPRIACPSCGSFIAMDDVNAVEGVAFCRACGAVTRLGDTLPRPGPEAADPRDALAVPPPRGCRVEDDGVTLRVIASARSAGAAVGALLFSVVWMGVVGVFAGVVVLSLWVHLIGPLPSWAPSRLTNAAGGSTMPLVLAAPLAVLLTPFVIVGVYMMCVAVTAIMGNVVVTIREGEGTTFVGVGGIGRRRRFDALAVRSVRIYETATNESRTHHILIEADKKLLFGSILTEARRAWMVGVLRAVLLGDGGGGGRATLPPAPNAGPPLLLPKVSS